MSYLDEYLMSVKGGIPGGSLSQINNSLQTRPNPMSNFPDWYSNNFNQSGGQVGTTPFSGPVNLPNSGVNPPTQGSPMSSGGGVGYNGPVVTNAYGSPSAFMQQGGYTKEDIGANPALAWKMFFG